MVKIPRVHHKTKTKNEELVVFQSGKVMRDFSKNGKEQPWQKRKIENVKYADYLEILEFKKAHKVKECAEVLEFKIDDNGEKKLYRVWFCKSRLCPLCSWRRAKKAAFQLQQILQEAHDQQPKAEFVFLTLTTKNTTEKKELRAELQKLRLGVVKLFRYKKVKKNLLGFIRATEITVNKNDRSYNQHVHVLAMVSHTYFKNSENYLSQSEWQKLWRKAVQVDYDPVIFVEKVKAKPEKGMTSLTASALEVAKYQTKSKDYLTDQKDRDLKVIADLEYALKGTRQVTFHGIFRDVKKQLGLDDIEKGDLINTENEDEKITPVVKIAVAQFDFEKQNYFWR